MQRENLMRDTLRILKSFHFQLKRKRSQTGETLKRTSPRTIQVSEFFTREQMRKRQVIQQFVIQDQFKMILISFTNLALKVLGSTLLSKSVIRKNSTSFGQSTELTTKCVQAKSFEDLRNCKEIKKKMQKERS